MTFDARGGNKIKQSDLLFGGGAAVLIVVIFLGVLLGPGLFGGKSAETVSTPPVELSALHQAYPDQGSRAFLEALQKADAWLYAETERKVAAMGNADQRTLNLFLMEQSEKLISRNASLLAKADSAYLDNAIDWMRQGVASANRSGTQFCRGSFYSSFSGASSNEIERMVQQMVKPEGPVYAFVMKGNALNAEAIAQARVNPVNHGRISASDKRAIQSVFMNLMSDPQIQRLAISANSKSDPEAALRSINVCQLADRVLVEFKKLPSETKGRLLAESARSYKGGNPFASIGEFSGF